MSAETSTFDTTDNEKTKVNIPLPINRLLAFLKAWRNSAKTQAAIKDTYLANLSNLAALSGSFPLKGIIYNADEKRFLYSCRIPLNTGPEEGIVIIKSNIILVKQGQEPQAMVELQPKVPPVVVWPCDEKYHIVLRRQRPDSSSPSPEYAYWKPCELEEKPRTLRPYLAARVRWTNTVDVPWRNPPIIKYYPLDVYTDTVETHPAELNYEISLSAGNLAKETAMIFSGSLHHP